MNLWYFSSTVYSFDVMGRLSVGMPNLIKLVLPISVAFWRLFWGTIHSEVPGASSWPPAECLHLEWD